MGKSSSSDLRVRIFGEIESGHSCRAAARRFGVSAATAVRLAQRKVRTGSITPERQGRPPGRGPLSAHADVLVSWVDAEGDITMPELADRLFKEHGGEGASSFTVPVVARARIYRQKKLCWRAKPIALTLFAPGAYGSRTGSPG
jgi:transposase